MTEQLREWSDDEAVLMVKALEEAAGALRRVAATVEGLPIPDYWQPGMARRRRMERDVARCRQGLWQLCYDLGHQPRLMARLPARALRHLQGDGTTPPPAAPYDGLPVALEALESAASALASARELLLLGAPARLVDRLIVLEGRVRVTALQGQLVA